MSRIIGVQGREVLDSRGWPTVEAEVTLDGGAVGIASVPSGASTGAREALELRDGDPARYRGRGVRRAVEHVSTELAAAVLGTDAESQNAIDQQLIDCDGTANKSRLGANAILAISLATARAAANDRRVPLWQHLNEVLLPERQPLAPLPMVNILSGGHHAGFQLDIQDVLIFPWGAASTADALAWTNAVYYAVRDLLKMETGYGQLVADEGGFGPNLVSNEAALEVVTRGIELAGLTPGEDVSIALDVAAAHFYRHGQYVLSAENLLRDSASMIELLESWVERYPVVSIEDGLSEDDWDAWPRLTARLGDQVQVVGDDLFTTNPATLRRGIGDGIANSVLVKVNQIGTLSEAAETCRMAFEAGYTAVISARSGETEDSFLADWATATGAGQIKIGSIARSERLAKYNQMLRIEEQMGAGSYAGKGPLRRWAGV